MRLFVFIALLTLAAAFNARIPSRRQPSIRQSTLSMDHKLVLVRHGESTWNLEGKFTGWYDCPLSENGAKEAQAAGKELDKAGYKFDIAFTSMLKRAIRTCWYSLEETDSMYVPIVNA